MKGLQLSLCLFLAFSCSHDEKKHEDRPVHPGGIKAEVGSEINLTGSLGPTDALALADNSIAYSYSQVVQIDLKESINALLHINNLNTDCAEADVKLATIDVYSESLTVDARKMTGNFLIMDKIELGVLARGRNTLNFSINGSKSCKFSLTAIVESA